MSRQLNDHVAINRNKVRMQMYKYEGDLPYPIEAKVLGYVPKYTISMIKTIKTSDLCIYNVTIKTLVRLKRTISL